MDDQDQQEQGQQDEAQVSQETPGQDSALQTPQADQPVPTENKRDGEGQVTQPAEGTQDESAPPAPDSRPDAYQQEAQREVERQEQRQVHNERTGGGDVTTTERVEQREVHNERVGGGVQSDGVDGTQDGGNGTPDGSE